MMNIVKTFKNFELIQEGVDYTIKNTLTDKILAFVFECSEDETIQEFNACIEEHTIKNSKYNEVVKRVIWNELKEDYEQLQAVREKETNTFTIQYYNSDMLFIDEIETDYIAEWEVLEHFERKNIVKGLRCSVLTDKELGDCTNNGISKKYNSLTIVGENLPKVSEVENIDQLVYVDNYKGYLRVKPVIYINKHYMAGGNFLYSCDSRFREISQYPLSIHDRIE